MSFQLSTTEALRYATGQSVLGPFAVAVSGNDVVAVVFGKDRQALTQDLRRRFPGEQREDAPALAPVVDSVAALIASPARRADLKLAPSGSAFQKRVWRELQRIPAGRTASYGDIARRIGAPRSARAVAQACAANPIAVAIPCHRVVRGDGTPGGYRWGPRRKALLLQAEAGL